MENKSLSERIVELKHVNTKFAARITELEEQLAEADAGRYKTALEEIALCAGACQPCRAVASAALSPAEHASAQLLCECGHAPNIHTPCCVSACGCDNFTPRRLTDADVDAMLLKLDDARFNTPEWRSRVWEKFQKRLADDTTA